MREQIIVTGSTTSEPPVVSVVIPCHNAALTLAQTLEAMLRQTFAGSFEVILVNNGSTDESVAIARKFQKQFPHFTILDATEKLGAGYARNVGVSYASADRLLFCDADDIADHGWITAMVAALEKADLVGGRREWRRLNQKSHPAARKPEGSLDVNYLGPDRVACVGAGNMGIWRHLFELLDGFDTRLPIHEDSDLCLRAHNYGFHVSLCPDAIIHVRARHGLRATFKQGCAWGYWSVPLYTKHVDLLGKRSTMMRQLLGWPLLFFRLFFIFRVGYRTTWVFTAGWKIGQTYGYLTSQRFRR